MAKLAFCDYHNMVAILEKTEHNTDFHQIVDFLEASHIRNALMIRPTVYVSHIRQFWSTARVETTDEETKILAQVNGRQRTVSESSIRRHLKLNDEEDETAFPTGDIRYGEAFPTDTSLDAGQDKKSIAKTFAMPHEALPMVTSLGGGEGIGDTVKDSDKSTDKKSDSTDEMSHVLGSLGAVNILASGGLRLVFTTASLSVATASIDISLVVATASGSFLTVQKDKGKGKMTELEQPKLAKRDSEIARIHAEKELKMMIAELDRSNEMIAKYLSEYEQAAVGLSHDEKKAEDFKGMNFEQTEEKFISVWEKMQDFVPMNSKLESERLKRSGIQLDKERSKELKTAEALGTESSLEQQSKEPKELSEEELKKMMELVPVKELYIEALQVKYPIIDWEIYSEDQRKCWKIIRVGNHTEVYQLTIEVIDEKAKELWVELKRLYEPDSRDPLWDLQRYMHDPLVWRLYDTCGVHHVSTGREHQIFMLVKKDYPLIKGLKTLMVSNKLQVDQYSEMANELLMKIHVIANSPR
nr:hypothetical protein [Tanacetum cinerariifolium]